MKRIMFVCHGNICRSPMAEFILKDMLQKKGLKGFTVGSSATSSEEIGNPVYSPARAELKRRGIGGFEGKRAVRLKRSDYDFYDLFVGMDDENVYNMRRLFDGDEENKVVRLMDFTWRGGEVSDPWYTGDFKRAFDDIFQGVEAMLESILRGE